MPTQLKWFTTIWLSVILLALAPVWLLPPPPAPLPGAGALPVITFTQSVDSTSLQGTAHWLTDATTDGFSPDSAWRLFDSGFGRPMSAWRAAHHICFGRYAYWVQFRVRNDGADTLRVLAHLPYARACWRAETDGHLQPLDLSFTGDGHSSSFATATVSLPPGREHYFLAQLQSYSIGADIAPMLWSPTVCRNRQRDRWLYTSLMEGLLNGGLCGLSLLSLMLFAFRRSAVYGWYALFLGLILLYFWRDFEDDVTLFWSTMAWSGWTEGKVGIAMLTYAAYLQFVCHFLGPVPGKPWLGGFLHTVSILLLTFWAVDTFVFWDKTHYNTGWLFFCALRMVIVPLAVWILYHIWRLPGAAAGYLRLGASILVGSSLVTCFFIVTDWGRSLGPIDLNVLPIRFGVLLEAAIYLLALDRRELFWLEEQLQFDAQLTLALEEKQRQSEQLSAELLQALVKVKTALEQQTEQLAAAQQAQSIAEVAGHQRLAERAAMQANVLHTSVTDGFANLYDNLPKRAPEETDEQLMVMAGELRERLETQLLVETA